VRGSGLQVAAPGSYRDSGPMQTNRLEAFSDGVFAIAITLLILEVDLPPGGGSLAARLAGAWPGYVMYAVSFVTIGVMWANHHSLFHLIDRCTHGIVVANLLLLLLVSFVPFPTSVLANTLRGPATDARAAAVFYNGTFVLIAVVFNALWHTAVRGRLLGPGTANVATRITRSYALGPPSYLAAALASTHSAQLGLTINGLLVLLYLFTPRAPLGEAA
jgi:uncharacterized membrane protein